MNKQDLSLSTYDLKEHVSEVEEGELVLVIKGEGPSETIHSRSGVLHQS